MHHRFPILSRLAACLLGLGLYTGASALTVRVDAGQAPRAIDEQITANIIISELPPGSVLGAFLLEVTFDPAKLVFVEAQYGPALGDPDDLLQTAVTTTSGPSSVALDEFSFLLDLELEARQPDAFSLATVAFDAVGTGVTTLGFGEVDLAVESGGVFTTELVEADVTIVPIPGTLPLLVGAFALLAALRRHNDPRA